MKSGWLIAFVAAGLAQSQSDDRSPLDHSPLDRSLRWRQDLDALSAGMKAPGIRIVAGLATRGQKDFAILYPNFDREVESIKAELPQLTDPEVLLRLMRLMASAHVAHNSVETPVGMGFGNRLPLNFVWFPDGLAVTAATSEYTSALGSRVLSIGGLKAEAFLTDLKPYVSYENDVELHQQAANLMNARGVLEHFHLMGADGRVALEVEKSGGESARLSLPFVMGKVDKIGLAEGLHLPVPLYRSHPRQFYWHQYLPDSRTLFIQYNTCANDPKRRFAEFAREVLADADAHPVGRVVIDLRWNGGGNSRVISPLISGLEVRRKSVGPIYLLIGPTTFSSAVDNAVEMQAKLSAKLVGSPSGGMPGGYGEVAKLTLPNSRLVIRYTTKNFGVVAWGGAKALEPDIAAPIKIDDFLAGRDPGLEGAIHAQ